MLTLLSALALAAAPDRQTVGNLVLEGVPDTPAELRERLRQYQATRSAGVFGWAAGGERLFVGTRFGEVSQLHAVDTPLGARHQLTFFDEPVSVAVPSPVDPDQILLTRDVGGSEFYQVALLDLGDGRVTQLSDGEGRCTDPVWSDDGQRVAWVQTAEGSTRHAVIATRGDDGWRRERVWTGEGYWIADDFTPDGGLLMFHYIAADASEVHQLDVSRGRLTPIDPQRDRVAWGSSALSPDGQTLWGSHDHEGEFKRLWRFDLTKRGGKGKRELVAAHDADIVTVRLSPDGSRLLYVLNDQGRSALHLIDITSRKPLPVPELPPGIVSNPVFSPDGARVALSLNRADAPSDVYTFAVGEDALTRWTHSEVGGLDTSRFVQPEFFTTPSFDGLAIPGFVYRPPGDGPHPVVVAIHGGPEAQSRPWFSSTYQFWATELGVAVVVPNVRGSTGYGRTYHTLDNGLKRKDSVADIGAMLDWIAADPTLDDDRVVVYGGSYGGYMVLASMIDHGDRLAGGVDIVGISDFKTFLTNTMDYRRDLRRAEYGDERDPKLAAFFDEISPLRNAGRIQDPLFVIQGANDPRVPASEAEQIVGAVREAGNQVWYMLAMDEGHGFRKKTNRDRMNEAVTLFLQDVFGL